MLHVVRRGQNLMLERWPQPPGHTAGGRPPGSARCQRAAGGGGAEPPSPAATDVASERGAKPGGLPAVAGGSPRWELPTWAGRLLGSVGGAKGRAGAGPAADGQRPGSAPPGAGATEDDCRNGDGDDGAGEGLPGPLLRLRLIDFGSAVDAYSLGGLYGGDGPTAQQITLEYAPPEALFGR
jgi:hypothetical protein